MNTFKLQKGRSDTKIYENRKKFLFHFSHSQCIIAAYVEEKNSKTFLLYLINIFCIS